jgi:hypothetical protein
VTDLFRPRRLLAALLLVSAVLRVALALQGGQFFLADEARYTRGVAIYQALRTGDAAGLREELKWPEHAGFNLLNSAVAALQHALAQLTASGDWTQPQNIFATAPLAAAVLGLCSVLNIWLVHRLARAAGAGEAEALWAALLMAASNTLFYYSRHLLPYDSALAAALGALIFALTPAGRPRAAASGALAALTYGLYNGYWFLPPVVFLALLLSQPDGAARRTAGLRWSGGFLGLLALLLLPGTVAGGAFYWRTLFAFSGTVRQGLFAEGWSLPGEYFWHAEGWLGLVVGAGVLFAAVRAVRPGAESARLRLWLLLLAAAYLLPVAASVGLKLFVVYARTCRPLVPLLCLPGAWALHTLAARRPRLGPPLVAFIVAGAGAMFVPHFYRVFPRDVEFQVLGQYGLTKHWLSFTGSIYQPLVLPVKRPDLVLVNAQRLYPLRDYRGYPPGAVLFSVAHPLAYRPYQYEAHTPRERALLRGHAPAIQLIRLADPAAVPDDPPAALNFTAADRADGFDHRRAP